ncbi:endonuclease/exonuclease/phosphatase family protein [Actinophytocola xinjiangensis]|uniref:endonuclease/exonuclease/phosphatase family protein n=1 Tax=Actinophytocola xinjiangensis TaxID=485602 RepID=UPI0013903EC1|nr:endonuclease/exonuclease/phosphatase family protein [Actinophytocola xinjiangensis]
MAGLVATPAQPGSASIADGKFTVLQWNVWGGLSAGSVTEQARAVQAVIAERDPDFVVLNELCQGQYKNVQGWLQRNGWPQGANYSRFDVMDRRGGCDGTGTVGTGIYSRYELAASSPAEVTRLVNDPDFANRVFSLRCVMLRANTSVKMCATHISPGADGVRDTQVGQVAATVNSYVSAGDVVVLAGDLNTQPHEGRLNQLYSASVDTEVNGDNVGEFRELDDRTGGDGSYPCLGYGQFTKYYDRDIHPAPPGCGARGKKIDYVFVSENRLGGGYDEIDVLPIPNGCGGPCSDHHAVLGGFAKDFTVQTPDGYVRPIYHHGEIVATVEWNDHADDDHGRDLDDLTICDVAADSLAPYLKATNNGQTFEERIDGGKDHCETQGVGDLSPEGATMNFEIHFSAAGSSGPTEWNGITYTVIE